MFRFFSPLKTAYSDILHKHSQAALIAEAQKIVFTPENIHSGFWYTGLVVPLDFEIIRRALNIPVDKLAGLDNAITTTSSLAFLTTSLFDLYEPYRSPGLGIRRPDASPIGACSLVPSGAAFP